MPFKKSEKQSKHLLLEQAIIAWSNLASEVAVRELMQILQNEKYSLAQAYATKALAKIGPDAKQAVPALIQALKNDDWSVRGSAAEALEEINIEAEATKDADFDFQPFID